jgi:hypothetical protein
MLSDDSVPVSRSERVERRVGRVPDAVDDGRGTFEGDTGGSTSNFPRSFFWTSVMACFGESTLFFAIVVVSFDFLMHFPSNYGQVYDYKATTSCILLNLMSKMMNLRAVSIKIQPQTAVCSGDLIIRAAVLTRCLARSLSTLIQALMMSLPWPLHSSLPRITLQSLSSPQSSEIPP